MAKDEPRIFSALLRHFRTRRGLSQLDLSLIAEISSRHLSFLETGRSQPSREMVLILGAALDVPLRDQNVLLRAAGFSEEFTEPSLVEGMPPPIEQALRRMLEQQEPYPMTVLNQGYDVIRANNAALRILSRFVRDPAALTGTPNVMRMLFDRRLGRDFVADWERVARALLSRLQREALGKVSNKRLTDLLQELLAYPDVPQSFHSAELSHPSEPTLSLVLRRDDLELGFLTTVTVFNAPQNITLEELRIESYFPLDENTARACRRLAGG